MFSRCRCPGCDIALSIVRCHYWGKLGKGYKGSLRHLLQLHVKSIIISNYRVSFKIKITYKHSSLVNWLPYCDLSFRVHHVALGFLVTARGVDEVQTGLLTRVQRTAVCTSGPASANLPRSLAEGGLGQPHPFPFTVRPGLLATGVLPSRPPQPPQRPQQELPDGRAPPQYTVSSNVRSLWKLNGNLLYRNQIFKHVAHALPAKATVSCM